MINGPDIQADGKGRQLATMNQYLGDLTRRLDQLEGSSTKRAGGITYITPAAPDQVL